MLAGEIMTRDVATVGLDASIEAVIALMVARGASGVPVVTEQGQLAGIITEGDLLRRVETATIEPRRRSFLDLLLGPGREVTEYVRSHSRRVSDLMTEQVISVAEDTPLAEVVRIMETKRVRRVPVLRDGRLVGIISRADLVRALGRRLAELAAPLRSASDDELELRVRAALGRVSLFDNSNIDVRVEDGAATVEGVIHDERLRPALRVAVETVPGILTVIDKIIFVEPVTGSIYPA
jgi:CBS domain-containing protein